MAAGILSEPGSEYGPCKDGCHHTDCAATRKQAEAECPICDKPIGYGVRFYAHRVNNTFPVEFDHEHAACVERQLKG